MRVGQARGEVGQRESQQLKHVQASSSFDDCDLSLDSIGSISLKSDLPQVLSSVVR